MGTEYYLLKSKDKTFFNLGKGDFYKPLQEFGNYNQDETALTSPEFYIAQRTNFKRTQLGNTKVKFIQNYIDYLKDYLAGFKDENMFGWSEGLAKKIYDFCGDEEVWVYSDGIFDFLERSDWKMVGSRYKEKCDKCHKEIEHINEFKKGKFNYEYLCAKCYDVRAKLSAQDYVLHQVHVEKHIRIRDLKPKKKNELNKADYKERLKEKGWEKNQYDAIMDAERWHKGNKHLTISTRPGSNIGVISYYLNVWITKSELAQIEQKAKEEYERKVAHNKRYDEDPEFRNNPNGIVTRYVLIDGFEIASKVTVLYKDLFTKRFNATDKVQERLNSNEHELFNIFGAINE